MRGAGVWLHFNASTGLHFSVKASANRYGAHTATRVTRHAYCDSSAVNEWPCRGLCVRCVALVGADSVYCWEYQIIPVLGFYASYVDYVGMVMRFVSLTSMRPEANDGLYIRDLCMSVVRTNVSIMDKAGAGMTIVGTAVYD